MEPATMRRRHVRYAGKEMRILLLQYKHTTTQLIFRKLEYEFAGNIKKEEVCHSP